MIPSQYAGNLLDWQGKRYKITPTGLQDITGQNVQGDVFATTPEEFAYLQGGGVGTMPKSGLQGKYFPTYEQTYGSVAAKAAGQAYNPANVGSGFRPRNADEPLYEYLNAKKAFEIGQTGTSTIGNVVNPAIGQQAAEELSNAQAMTQLKQEAKNIAQFGTAAPNPAQLAAGTQFNKDYDTTLGLNNLGTTPTANFQTAPAPAIVPSALGPTEAAAQAASEAAQAANLAMAGQGAFELQQEANAGLPVFEATLRDLNSQMDALSAESASIRANLEAKVQAGGQGMSAEIFNRQETALINQNTIKKLNLSVSINAMQGRSATAKDQAQRAVDAKYKPLQEALTIAQNNLQLIINSPKYDAEIKAKAQKMLDNKKAQQDILDKQVKVAEAINDWKVKVAATGKADAATLAKFDTLKTEAEVAALAAPYLKTEIKTPTPAKMTDTFKAWYYKTFNQLAKESDLKVQAEWQRWQETGAGAKTTSSEREL